MDLCPLYAICIHLITKGKNIMSNYSCKFGDHFIAPLVTAKVGKVEKPVNMAGGDLALNLAYIVMAMGEDASKFDDKTKREAGTACLTWLESFNPEAVFTFHFPKDESSLRQWDVSKWTPSVSATVKDMTITAKALAAVDTILQGVQSAITDAVKPATGITAKVINPLPVTGKAKRAGGSKSYAPIEF